LPENKIDSSETFVFVNAPRAVTGIGRTALALREAMENPLFEYYTEEEMLKFKIEMVDGNLASLLSEQNGELGFEYPPEKIWNPDGISLARRIEEDPSLKERIDTVLVPKNLSKYIVKADMKAPTRCIDGRRIKNWAVDKKVQRRGLGPNSRGHSSCCPSPSNS